MYLKNIVIDESYLTRKESELKERMKNISNNKYILSFSCGKDSIVLLHYAHMFGLDIIPVHYYIIDKLSYNDEVSEWCENKYNIKINNILSPIYSKMKAADLLCINRVWEMRCDKVNPFKKVEKLSKLLFKTDWNLIGIKKNDSPTRRMNISVNGWYQENCGKVYPLFDWSDKDVWMCIKKYNLIINRCYEWFGRSQDVVNIKHLYPLKDKSPDDYDRFVREFPLIEPMVWLYEKRLKEGLL
jgi:3'-phosphoadenosine 5'-phosphosulfate sulfotransferase (PAPS reductase)/FAD synthetase